MIHKKKLANVTLLGIDCVDISRLIMAADICQMSLEFGEVRLLSSLAVDHPDVEIITPIKSKEDYSYFIIKKLNSFFDTEFVLIIQYDGFILNPKAWTNEFLQYDYIGAPWWYNDGMNVGNGGFSLRSKKLQKILQVSSKIKNTFPEDHHICRTYRNYLEDNGIRFAPEKLARRFSIEGIPKKLKSDVQNKWTNEFGFHGLQKTDISNWLREHVTYNINNILDKEFIV